MVARTAASRASAPGDPGPAPLPMRAILESILSVCIQLLLFSSVTLALPVRLFTVSAV